MKKRIFTSIFILFTALLGITAQDYYSPESIILLTQKTEIPYTISLNYNNESYNSEYIIGTGFDTNYQSEDFSIELSTGNIAIPTQYVITIEPGNFINYQAYDYVTNSYITYALDFKPTPTVTDNFPIQNFSYNNSNKKLTITTNPIASGFNVAQPIAKFSMGWTVQNLNKTTPQGNYISTILIEYICNDISNV
jgi:hypothetical protein